jgi:hypothetical protein
MFIGLDKSANGQAANGQNYSSLGPGRGNTLLSDSQANTLDSGDGPGGGQGQSTEMGQADRPPDLWQQTLEVCGGGVGEYRGLTF